MRADVVSKAHMRIAIFVLSLSLVGSSTDAQRDRPHQSETPVSTPSLFAPNAVNTDGDEYGPTFTPDGRTIYYTRRNTREGDEFIVYSRFRDGEWATPAVAPFSGRYYDKEPFVAPDGSKLFFASTRPAAPGGPDTEFDLYMVEREGSGWGGPRRLSSLVNSSDYDNYPSVSANGNLYFGSRREGGLGLLDLYVSRYVDGEYEAARNLGPTINSPATDADPFVAADESYLIFSSTREGGYGSGDLYVSQRRNASCRGIWATWSIHRSSSTRRW